MLVEDLASELADVIFLDVEAWELLLYSGLSVHAPKMKINGVPQRQTLHVNMIGEISTAKSSVIKILSKIFPKTSKVSKTTEASIAGTVKPDGTIVPGVIEQAHNGILFIPEYNKKISRMNIIREAMDNDVVTVSKRGVSWSFTPNVAFIVASNPKNDFFESPIMRKDIPFKEGILSRFDVLLPFLNDNNTMNEILQNITFLNDERKELDIEKLRKIIKNTIIGMEMLVERIKLTKKQEQMIKRAYAKNITQMGDRPRVVLRDLETLIRLVNVIVAVNCKKDPKKKIYTATNEDVTKAIDLWKYLINLRVQLYSRLEERKLMTPEQFIYDVIKQHEQIPTKQLIRISNDYCSRRTVYRVLDRLEKKGKIVRLETHKESSSVKIAS